MVTILRKFFNKASTLLAITLLYSGCGKSHKTGQETPIVPPSPPDITENSTKPVNDHPLTEPKVAETFCPTGLKSFQESVYPLVRDRCVNCHDHQPSGTSGPRFAYNDVAASYAAIRRLVDFNKVTDSLLYKKGGNLHCLKSYGYDCHTDFSEIEKNLRQWVEHGEKDCERLGRFFSESIAIPEDLPSRSQGFRKLQWKLPNLDHQASNDIRFEMEVQIFDAGNESYNGTYRFRKPRLLAAKDSVYIKDLKILVNSIFDQSADSFRSIDQVVNPHPIDSNLNEVSGSPSLSTQSLIVLRDLPGHDKIKISFEDFKIVTTPVSCSAQATFNEKVLPALNARNCYQCHGGGPEIMSGTQDARSMLNMALPESTLCAELLQRAGHPVHSFSPLIMYPYNGKFDHPIVFTSRREIDNSIIKWLDAEKNQNIN